MFKVDNKDTKMTPAEPPGSSVSIFNFEQVNAGWVAPHSSNISH